MFKSFYIIDNNILLEPDRLRNSNGLNLITTADVKEEFDIHKGRLNTIKDYKIEVKDLKKEHYEKLKEVIKIHGNNNNLIKFSENKGSADPMIIAYILAEIEKDKGDLFPNNFIIVTKDEGLKEVAQKYKIETVDHL